MLSERFELGNKSIIKLSTTQKYHLDEVNRKIVDKKYIFQLKPCICRSDKDSYKIVSKVDRYGINLQSKFCNNCGTIRVDPYLDSNSLSDFYKNHYQNLYRRYHNINDYFKKQEEYAQELENLLIKKKINFQSIFEIGCGAGGAINYFKKKNYKVGGSEYSGELLNFINRSDIKKFIFSPEKVTNYNYDIIFLNHVFEHIDDPEKFLIDIINKMKNETKIILTVPDYSRIDKFKYPGGNLMSYIHIAHKFNFSYQSFFKLCNHIKLNVEHLLINTTKSEFTVILGKNKNFSNKVKIHDPEYLHKYLITTEKKYKYLLNIGQIQNIHYILLRKIYDVLPENIKFFLKKIKNFFK